MIAAVEGLIAELRIVGIPISAAEYADAVTALRHVDLGDRTSVKTALGAALVKDAKHESAYSVVFDLYFARGTRSGRRRGRGRRRRPAGREYGQRRPGRRWRGR